jgi:hypothetical protein
MGPTGGSGAASAELTAAGAWGLTRALVAGGVGAALGTGIGSADGRAPGVIVLEQAPSTAEAAASHPAYGFIRPL